MKWLLDFLKGTWLGHPLHPVLVHVPMAMWPGALIFDLLSRWNGNAMVRLSFYAIILGLRVHTFRKDTIVTGAPLALSIIGTALLIGSAYLGGLMVYDYGISVARMSKKKWRKIAEAGGANLPPE